MVVRSLTALAVVSLGLSGGSGCSTVDAPQGGANAPCTRTADCGAALACIEGVCREPDAGMASGDSGADAPSSLDDAGDRGDG